MSSFGTSEFAEAIALPDHNQAVDRVKEIAIRHMVSTDERVSVRKTQYFNHSFVPDLVLSWKSEPDERYVFLRPEADVATLAQDMQLSRDIHPVYYSLTQLGERQDLAANSEMESLSRKSDSLITDSFGLESLALSRRNSPVAGLATSAVLQGARGPLDANRAILVTRALVDGISAASEIDAERAAGASRVIGDYFDAKRSSRLKRLLQAVWVGSGGLPANFPGNVDLAAGLDEESISYLLQIDLIDDTNFWKRIGRKLNLKVLAGLRAGAESPNFQMLVGANLDVLIGRVCRVATNAPTLFDPDSASENEVGRARWDVYQGNLALHGNGYTAYVADNRSTLAYPEIAAPRTRFDELSARLSASRVAISELTLTTEGKTVSYSSESEIDPVHERRLRAISRALGAGAIVQSVVVLVPEHSSLTCDFKTSTTSGKTSASYPIADLIRISVALLTDLGQDRQIDVASATSQIKSEPPTLFD